MSGAVVAALVLLAAAAVAAYLAAPLYLRLFRRELTRAEAIERAARQLGLDFFRTDPAFPGSTPAKYPFELFSRGVRQECDNLFAGAVGGVQLIGFDFRYVDPQPNRDDGGAADDETDAVWQRVTCVVALLGGSAPHVLINAVGTLGTAIDSATWATWGIQNRAIQFESREFDRVFNVRSADSRFAKALIDAEMMAWLLATGPRWQWELQREYALCTAGLVPPEDLQQMVTTVMAFARLVPRVATVLHFS
ncbi:MAG: hypothetical protein AUH85_16025 [Chloroflexi bacterium 13_1_40CM_4_68_4]|nr:MAG: hypothetical protein AUH85_16025 [Chloroflexi bacterium 13_1_40CM_4_68_4]